MSGKNARLLRKIIRPPGRGRELKRLSSGCLVAGPAMSAYRKSKAFLNGLPWKQRAAALRRLRGGDDLASLHVRTP